MSIRFCAALTTFALYGMVFLVIYASVFSLAMVNLYAYFLSGASREPSTILSARVHPLPFDQGVLNYQRRNYKEAEKFFLQVSPQDVKYPLALRFVGTSYLRLDKPLLAVPFINRAVLHNPWDSDNWFDMWETYATVLKTVLQRVGSRLQLLCLHCLA